MAVVSVYSLWETTTLKKLLPIVVKEILSPDESFCLGKLKRSLMELNA